MATRKLLTLATLLMLSVFMIGCGADPALMTIQVSPASSTASTGNTVQFSAMGTYQHGQHPATTQDVTSQVTWTSSNQSVATISASGAAIAVGAGTTTIKATMTSSGGPVSGTASFSVTGTPTSGGATHNLTSIALIPGTQALNAVGETAQFIAIGNYDSSPTAVDLTNSVTWKSSNPSVSTVNSSGLATAAGCAVSSCTVTITATATALNGAAVVGTGTLTISPGANSTTRTLTTLSIIPSTQALNSLGESAQFIGMGTFSASPTTQNMAGGLTWQSSNTSVATVDSTGKATAVGCSASSCVATITASAISVTGSTILGSAALTVNPGAPATSRTLTNITIIPGTGTQTVYALGETAQFLAIGTYSASPVTDDITNQVTWGSVDTNVATINSSGFATAVSCADIACTTTITATLKASTGATIYSTSNLTIKPAGGGSNLPSLGIYLVGAGTGKVTSAPAGITCTSGSAPGCTGFFVSGSDVTLTAAPDTGKTFGGWSANCVPSAPPSPLPSPTCTVKMNGNQSVGAIFN